jgi:hypothetical protein
MIHNLVGRDMQETERGSAPGAKRGPVATRNLKQCERADYVSIDERL